MMKLYKPLQHKPASGRGYKGAEPFDTIPFNAPYEPSFITLDEFAGQFWTWGMFASLEGADAPVIEELRNEGWEPRTDATQTAFFILENQFAQTLIVVEGVVAVRDWAQTEDIHHAQNYPVFLSYQTHDEAAAIKQPPAGLTMGTQALINDGTTWHLYTIDQLGEEGQALLTQIRDGMMLFPPHAEPTAQERRLREQARIARWEPTHTAAQQLAVLYWKLHQEHTTKTSPRAQSLPLMSSLHRTRLPLLAPFHGLTQSFGPAIQHSIWNQQSTGTLELMTPNGSHLRVIGTNTSENVALHHYVTEMLGPEGLKHLLILLDAYYFQTRGEDRKTDARVSLRQLLIRLGRGSKADEREEQGKLMHTILYLASTYITSQDSPASSPQKGVKPQSLARQRRSRKSRQQDYSPLLIIERLKPGDDGTILIPDEVEYHLGQEFFEALFGTQQQFYTVPTAQLLQYHSIRQQQELLLAFYLSNALIAFAGPFSTPFPVLLIQSALQTQESLDQAHDRLRDASRVLFAIEQLERDELIVRTPHEAIDTALAAELVLAELKQTTKQEQETIALSTYNRIQGKVVYMRRQHETEVRKTRRAALQHLLDERFNTIVEFAPGRLLQEQIRKRIVAQEEVQEERKQAAQPDEQQPKQKKPRKKKMPKGEESHE